MTDDMLQWAQPSGVRSPLGVGEGSGADLVAGASPPPTLPDPRLKKPRHRPNNGRKRKYIGPCLSEPPWDLLRATGYPVPQYLECLPAVPAQWRAGHKAIQWKARVRAMWGTTCHLCGHGEAYTADHLVPLSLWGNQPHMAELSRPAHGVEGCPTCKVKCNSSRGNKEFARQIGRYKPPLEL